MDPSTYCVPSMAEGIDIIVDGYRRKPWCQATTADPGLQQNQFNHRKRWIQASTADPVLEQKVLYASMTLE